MTDRPIARLHLEFDLDADPIAGSVLRPGQSVTEFSGWMELARAIEVGLAEARRGEEAVRGEVGR
jgi:hypothetical protein